MAVERMPWLDEHVAALQSTEPIDQERLERMTTMNGHARQQPHLFVTVRKIWHAAC